MHFTPLLRTIAVLLIIVSGFMLFPIACALYYCELEVIHFFLYPMAIVGLCTLTVLLLTRKSTTPLSNRDGFLLVTFSWIFSALIGCLPLYLSGAIPSFADAFSKPCPDLRQPGLPS